MKEGFIPEAIRADIEAGVAAALNEPDLRAALERTGLRGIPDDQNDVDLIVMFVYRTRGASWPPPWRGSDTFLPFLEGYTIAAVQAQDIAAGRESRPMTDYQRERLEKWERQALYESE